MARRNDFVFSDEFMALAKRVDAENAKAKAANPDFANASVKHSKLILTNAKAVVRELTR